MEGFLCLKSNPTQKSKAEYFERRPNNTLSAQDMSVLVTQLCPTLCDPVGYNPPGSSVHGIPQEGMGLPCPGVGCHALF